MAVAQTDIVIAGGGAIGLSLGLALRQQTGYSVTLLEAFAENGGGAHPGFDARGIALAKYSLDFFQALGLGANLANISTDITHIHVSDKGHMGQTQLHACDYQVPQLGSVVELQDLGQVLQRACQDQFAIKQPCSIKTIDSEQPHLTLTLSDASQLQTRLLVVADGAQSPTSQLLKLGQQKKDYQQYAITANVLTSAPHQHWAYERFTANGPIALLPMSQNRSGLVWTVQPHEVEPLLRCSPQRFLQQLQAAFGYRLGRFTRVGERQSFPLKLTQTEHAPLHRVVVAGNAAQSLHPIAGQGLNLGLRDVQALTTMLAQSGGESNPRPSDNDPGMFAGLQQYRAHRMADRKQTIQLTDGLLQLFANESLPKIIARNIGLTAMAFSPMAKQRFAQHAMGWRGEQHG